MTTKVKSYFTSHAEERVKREYVEFLADRRFVVKCDLPFRQTAQTPYYDMRRSVPLTRDLASKTITKFLNKINRHYYKNAYRRYNKKILSASFIEGGIIEKNNNTRFNTYKNIHAHLILSKPEHADIYAFITFLRKTYPTTNEFSAPITFDPKTKTSTGRVELLRDPHAAIYYDEKESLDSFDFVNFNKPDR